MPRLPSISREPEPGARGFLAPFARWPGFLCLSLATSGPLAVADVFHPAEPDAYQPFTVTLGDSLHRPEGLERAPYIEAAEGVIYIARAGTGLSFGPVVAPIQGLPPGEYELKTVELSNDGSRGDVSDTGYSVSVSEAPSAIAAYTFFQPASNRYIVTVDEDERDRAPANGWYSTDDGFNVWPAEGPAPEAAEPVCRFYNERVDSRFFTASETECESLRQTGGNWTYEGIAFQALVPAAGACPSGTTPVWRLYNNRASSEDSNHRYVANAETYRTLVEERWSGEEVVFCSPQDTGME